MRENDIIENIRDLYDVKAPNVRGKLDFAAVEIAPPPEKKLNRRYIYAGIAYAAACLVVIGLIPFLIGKSGSEPVKPNPGMSAVAVDTSGKSEATDEPKENFTERDVVTEESAVSVEPDAPEESVSIDVYPIPVESDEPESVPAPEKDPPETKPAVTTSKKPDVPKATTPAVTEPVPPEPPRSKTYADPAKSTRIRFFKDIERTDEYKSASDIPYGAKVYYLMENDPGYIITNFKINVYWQGFDVDFIPNDGCGIPVDYFINNYLGDKLEYSYTAVLAGDADGNLYYDENDVNILRKYLDNDAEMLYKYGQYGYSERLDYDCNGVVTEKDLEGLLAEIENGTAERNTMSEHNYSSGVGTKTTLLKFDKATIMPHGLHPYQVEYDYSVHKTYAEAAILSKEIHDKYDPDFYVMEDLILIYCYTENGEMPELSELSALWHTHNNHTEYLIPVYSDDNKGQTLSEYAIVLEKQNNKYLSTPTPT